MAFTERRVRTSSAYRLSEARSPAGLHETTFIEPQHFSCRHPPWCKILQVPDKCQQLQQSSDVSGRGKGARASQEMALLHFRV